MAAMTATVTIDVRNLEHLKLFVWEMIELRDALRLEGQTDKAIQIDDAIRRLAHAG